MTTISDHVAQSFAALDAGSYTEPLHASDFRNHKHRFAEQGEDASNLLELAINRIEQLEQALAPFAVRGGTMLHLRRLLDDAGRHAEPAGGVWLNADNGAALITKEYDFLTAVDAVGRATTQRIIEHDIECHAAAQAVDAMRGKY